MATTSLLKLGGKAVKKIKELRRRSRMILETGPRGAGKTLLQTGLQAQDLVDNYIHYMASGQRRKVWSNYPVGFYYLDPVIGKWVYLHPEPLNMEALITFDKEMVEGSVYIDEIDLWYDRQEWSNVAQKLLSSVLQQIRKRKLTLNATIQDMKWLNSRGQFQTDVVIKCRDAVFSQWGRSRGLDMGEIINLSFVDKSGMETGYAFEEWSKTFDWQFWAKWVWDKYDTDFQFDVLASKTRYRLKVATRLIDTTGEGSAEEIELKDAKVNRDVALLADLIADYTDRDEMKALKKDFLQQAMDRGLGVPKNKAFPLLEELGVYIGGASLGTYFFDKVRG